jgi:hypothetical protein
LLKPVLSESIWRDFKVEVVGSNGFTGFPWLWPDSDPLAEEKKAEGELSVYCWTGCVGAMDRLRAGDGETPLLLAWGMLPDVVSPQAGRAADLQSVSELLRREPEPVLPSKELAGVPMAAAFSRGRELSLPLPLEPRGNVPIGAFQMFFPHGDACASSVSVPLLLSETPLE